MSLSYLRDKIMGADNASDVLVKAPFLNPEDLCILDTNNVPYKEVGERYYVHAQKAKAVFSH